MARICRLRDRAVPVFAPLAVGIVILGWQVATHGATPTPPAVPDVSKPVEDPVARLSVEIDREISARWTEEKIEPAPPADDSEFLRRTFLNIAGRIPSASEVQSFLEDAHKDKRRRVVDQLLETPAYPTHLAELLQSIFTPEVNTDPMLQFQSGPFSQWIRRQVAQNVGYDRIVREMLTASAGAQGPGFYFTAKGGKAENIAGGAARVFLGVRIECAQCHNHPFAKWRREQFWQFAAFFAGINADTNGQIREQTGLAELKIPDTTKLVKARYLDDASPDFGSNPRPRQTLAEWITADRNPYFARAAVNRVWAHFLGTGIVDPVDDFDESNPPSHPELLDTLATEFVRHKYDVKFLIRAICASRPYQLSSVQTDSRQSNRRLFARATVKGLTPGELAGSLAQAVGDFDGLEGNQFNLAPFYGQSQLRGMIMQLFKNENSEPVDAEATILQALGLMNSAAIDQSTAPSRGNTLSAVLDAPFLDTPGRIEMLFLATYSRRPTRTEAERLIKYVESGGTHSTSKPKLGNVFQQMIKTDKAKNRNDKDVALGDVFWALLNSSEFLTNH